MSPPTRRTGPREGRLNVEVTTTDTASIRPTSDIAAQIRRRRAAADQLPPMADGRRDPLDPCHCPRGEKVYLAGRWMELDVRDRRCHPDQLSDWATEGIRRHDEARKRSQAFMNDPANAEAVAIIRAMLNGEAIP